MANVLARQIKFDYLDLLNHPLLPPLVEVEGNQPLPAGVHQGSLCTLLLVIMLGVREYNWSVCGRGGLYLVSGGMDKHLRSRHYNYHVIFNFCMWGSQKCL